MVECKCQSRSRVPYTRHKANNNQIITTLSDFSTLRLEEANKLNIGGVLATTYENAQKTTVHTMKTMTNGLVASSYCIDSSSGCMMKRGFLGKRGFDDFLNEFYDDEGWWALAWIRASDATGNDQYLEAAIDIFNDMQTGTNTPCGGGIRWKKEGEDGSGYVNAIANELYLATAASLARRVSKNSTYLDIAKKQWNWFSDSGMINEKGLINDGLNGECKNNGLQTWSYNQGVILGALVELSLATGDDAYTDKAHKIIAKFSDSFQEVTYSIHEDQEGEVVGKGSNVASLFRNLALSDATKAVEKWDLIHILDVDTHHSQDYFDRVEAIWFKTPLEDRRKLFFTCPIAFNRNYNEVAWPVRIVDNFWALGGISSGQDQE